MSQVAEIIERIREIATEAEQVDADLDKAHGIDQTLGIRYDDPRAIARRRTANSAEVELENYLNDLDMQTLRRVEALMYSGRGDGTALELLEQFAESHPSKEDVVRTIMEKRVSFDHYFDRGLDLAKAEGLDLDTF